MKTKKILLGAFAICFVLVALSSCKNKKQAADTAAVVEQAPPAPPLPPTPPTVLATDSPDAPVEAARVIEYRRGACFGTCPIFTFKVYENGYAVYEGKNFVDMIGIYSAQVSKEEIAKIVSVAKSIGYFEMKDVYDNEGVTDLPATYTSIASSKEVKTVKNRYQGPKELKTLYDELDKLIKALQWKLVSNENKN